MDYVTGKAVENCGMCAHLRGDEVIWSDPHWVVTRVGDSEGCFHVICRRHVEGIWNLTEQEALGYGTLLRRLSGEIARACEPERVYVVTMGEKSQHMHSAVMARMKGSQPDPRFIEGILEHYANMKDAVRANHCAESVRQAMKKGD